VTTDNFEGFIRHDASTGSTKGVIVVDIGGSWPGAGLRLGRHQGSEQRTPDPADQQGHVGVIRRVETNRTPPGRSPRREAEAHWTSTPVRSAGP
jgi:hypothetical protein